MRKLILSSVLLATFGLVVGLVAACGDDDGTEADRFGVGAACDNNDVCSEVANTCLLNFAGGYCGIADCVGDEDCPSGSRCVAHDDGSNYCFLICTDKTQCNINRPVEVESNCSANITFVDGDTGVKACVPPSSGI